MRKVIWAAVAALFASQAGAERHTVLEFGDWTVGLHDRGDGPACVASVSHVELPFSFALGAQGSGDPTMVLVAHMDADFSGMENITDLIIDDEPVLRTPFVGVDNAFLVPWHWPMLDHIADGHTLVWWADDGQPVSFSLRGSAQALDSWIECIVSIQGEGA